MILKTILAACLSAALTYLIVFVWVALTLGAFDFWPLVEITRDQIRRGLLQYVVAFGWFAIIAFDGVSVVFYRLGLDEENREIVLRQDSPLGVLSRSFKWYALYPLVSIVLILIVTLG